MIATRGALAGGRLPGSAQRRALATLLVERHAVPKQALRLDAAHSAASSTPKHAQDVLVKMKASQITYRDLQKIRGLHSSDSTLGVGGTTGVGVVAKSDASHSLAEGDLVFVNHPHTWSDRISVPKTSVYKLARLPVEQAACLPTFLAAADILSRLPGIREGDAILQNNYDNILAQAIAQVGKAKGLHVVSIKNADATDSQHMAKVKQQATARFAISGKLGRPTQSLLRALASHGTLVVYEDGELAVRNAATLDVPVSSSIFHGSSVVGFDQSAWAALPHHKLQQAIDAIAAIIASRQVSLPTESFPVQKYEEAFDVAINKPNAVAVLTF